MKTIFLYLLLICLSFNLVSCKSLNLEGSSLRERVKETSISLTQPKSFMPATNKLAETATPIIVRELNKSLEQFTPQVAIVSPEEGHTFERTNIDIKLAVEDLPVFQDDRLNLGPHLNLVLDDEPYREIYNLDEAIAIDNLSPGTHTIRVFAVTPWQESFKNQEAYAQTTFNVLTATNDNHPDRNLPLLTYNQPQGVYGTEPIMLDFFLTDTSSIPLIAGDKSDRVKDWQVRVSVNGESFLLDRWQSIYLEGFEEGNNWVKLELLDGKGNNIDNTFNNTVKLVTYKPQKKNALDKLLAEKISLEQAQSIVKQSYYIQPVGEPEIIEVAPSETSLSDGELESESQILETGGNNNPVEESAIDAETIEDSVSEELEILEKPKAEIQIPTTGVGEKEAAIIEEKIETSENDLPTITNEPKVDSPSQTIESREVDTSVADNNP